MKLRTKLVAPVATAFALFVLLTHFYWQPQQLTQQKENFIEQEHEILNLLRPVLFDQLISRDFAALYLTLDSVMQAEEDEWLQVTLHTPEGHLLYPLTEPQTFPDDEKYLTFQYPISSKEETFASLTIVTDWGSESDDVIAAITRLEMGAIFIFGIITVLTIIWQHLSIHLPLRRLEKAANELSRGEFSAQLPKAGKDEIGNLTRAFGSMKNNLQQAVQKAQHGETRIRAILDTIQDGIITIDEMGIIQNINPAVEKLFGYTGAELIGCNISLLMDKKEATQHDGYLQRYREADGIRELMRGKKSGAQRKDGSTFPIELTVSEMFLGGERMFTGLIRDITKRQQAEQALISAKEEAERANLAKSEFLSRMSHELRTPMNAILGFAQLIKIDEDLSEEHQNYIQDIYDAGEHLLELINEVLDLSAVEAGQLSLSIEPVNVSEVFSECQTLMSPLAESNGIHLEVDFTGCNEFSVMADRIRYKQVLLNLLSNAIKYNRPNGNVLLACKSDKETLNFSVKDTGKGIKDEHMDMIFEPFNRLDASDSNIEGTGIGLLISRRLVETMGGKMNIESTPGIGSTFSIQLPKVAAVSTPTTQVLEKSTIEMQTSDTSHSLLYIEDSVVNRRLVQQIINRQDNLTLLTAPDGKQGLELAETHQPELILLDIGLPDMDGYEVLAQLKNNENTRKIPVIALSANAMAEDLERGKQAGFNTYLTKPLNIPLLLKTLDSLLNSKKTQILTTDPARPENIY